MSEIPLAGGGATDSKPREVTIAAWLVLLEAIVGLIVVGIEFAFDIANDYTLLGLVLVVVAFWLYTQILKQDYTAWMMAVIFNIIAIFLYAVGDNWPGVILSLICFIYLVTPNVKVHFEQNK
ncbi:hypothetical protein EU527_19795 [Candidatus Thorarchaeota archaeon]|nr:MAG: hypothetical protein EU527_19795 [Candidatus Thorarchaeota archaeon]